MANPFPAKFDSACNSCGDSIDEGSDTYAVNNLFVCKTCAEAEGAICICGNVKKPTFDKCYDCFKEDKEDSEWNPLAD